MNDQVTGSGSIEPNEHMQESRLWASNESRIDRNRVDQVDGLQLSTPDNALIEMRRNQAVSDQ